MAWLLAPGAHKFGRCLRASLREVRSYASALPGQIRGELILVDLARLHDGAVGHQAGVDGVRNLVGVGVGVGEG